MNGVEFQVLKYCLEVIDIDNNDVVFASYQDMLNCIEFLKNLKALKSINFNDNPFVKYHRTSIEDF